METNRGRENVNDDVGDRTGIPEIDVCTSLFALLIDRRARMRRNTVRCGGSDTVCINEVIKTLRPLLV